MQSYQSPPLSISGMTHHDKLHLNLTDIPVNQAGGNRFDIKVLVRHIGQYNDLVIHGRHYSNAYVYWR